MILKKGSKNKLIWGKRSLGQHFLRDSGVKNRLISAIDPQPSDTIIEIGPGRGELTIKLSKIASRVIGLEKDSRLVPILNGLGLKNLEIIEGDALKLLKGVAGAINGDYKLIGNIPYYITGHLLRALSDIAHPPRLIVLLVQKEVAVRLAARPPKMNLLAAATQIWADARILGNVPKKSFVPPPKIDSAIIRLTQKPNDLTKKDLKNYYITIKIIFKQPRKTIWNNLREAVGDETRLQLILERLDIKKDSRPQELGLEKLCLLAKAISNL